MNAFSAPVDVDSPLQGAAREAGWALMQLVNEIDWKKREQVVGIITRLGAALAEPAGEATRQCETCQGNGEIVTDWDRYLHPLTADVGDEAVTECPDCNGEGEISEPAGEAGPVAIDYLRGKIGEILELELDAKADSRPLQQAVERILALVTTPPASAIREAATHRHKKRGTEYVLFGIGKVQAEKWVDGTTMKPSYPEDGKISVSASQVDMSEVAIYRSVDDGSLWVRPREEFEDGRFAALAGSAE